MATVQARVDNVMQNFILVPCKRDDELALHHAIGEAAALVSVDQMVRNEIARIEEELEKYERPSTASSGVGDDDSTAVT